MTTGGRRQADWRATLREIATLPADWDGHASVPVPDNVIHVATLLLSVWERISVIRPFLRPGDDGALLLAWADANTTLEITLGSEGHVCAIRYKDQNSDFDWHEDLAEGHSWR